MRPVVSSTVSSLSVSSFPGGGMVSNRFAAALNSPILSCNPMLGTSRTQSFQPGGALPSIKSKRRMRLLASSPVAASNTGAVASTITFPSENCAIKSGRFPVALFSASTMSTAPNSCKIRATINSKKAACQRCWSPWNSGCCASNGSTARFSFKKRRHALARMFVDRANQSNVSSPLRAYVLR